MTGVPSYSTTASENINAKTGITWDEGMAPASVNNSARQNMADMRSQWNDASWFQYGAGSKTVAAVYASSTSVTFTGADATAYWHAGRRVKAVGSGTGTIYGKVASSSYGAGATTVNFTWDSGSLSNEALTVYASTMPVTGKPLTIAACGDAAEGTFTPTDASGAGLSLTVSRAAYAKVGNKYFVDLAFSYPSTADGSNAKIGLGALPSAANVTGVSGMWPIYWGTSPIIIGWMLPNTNTFQIFDAAGSAQHNVGFSLATLLMQFNYSTV